MMGSSIFIIGMSWTVAQIGGPKMFGLIWTAYFLGHLPLLLYGGMVVDRMPRRTVALIADLSQAVLVTLGIIALLAGFDEIKTLLVVTFLTGGATAFSIPAIGALVPDLVEEDLLPQANALRGVAMTAAWMLGPLIGGFTVGLWGIEVCLLIDVVTFIFSGRFYGRYQRSPWFETRKPGTFGRRWSRRGPSSRLSRGCSRVY